jgi:hypothetical protein
MNERAERFGWRVVSPRARRSGGCAGKGATPRPMGIMPCGASAGGGYYRDTEGTTR